MQTLFLTVILRGQRQERPNFLSACARGWLRTAANVPCAT